MIRRSALAALVALGLAPAGAQAQAPIKIPGPLDGPLPRFTGAPATPQPLSRVPRNQPVGDLAPDGRSGSGLAAGNGGATPFAGPLGNGTTRASSLMLGGCASLAFDAQDRLVAACNGLLGPSLRLMDGPTLTTLATLNLPVRPNADRGDRAGGTHLLVRRDGTLLVPRNDGVLATYSTASGGFVQTGGVALTGALAARERPFAVAAGADGRDWVVGTAGTVVTVGRDGDRAVRSLKLGEPVAEDLATDVSGAFVVTDRALYRLVADPDGTPRVVWREPVESGSEDMAAGRVHRGPGTPPVVIAGRDVAVADGADPPRLDVFRIGGRDRDRVRCSVPLFAGVHGSVEAQLVVAGRSVVAANAYGYSSLLSTEGGATTTGGLQRVVVGARGCRTAWRTALITPSAQPTVSLANGLLYTLEKPRGFPDAWNLVGVDWRTGVRRFGALAGEGLGFNSDGGAVVVGPDGAAYAGTFGGVVRFADRPAR